MPRDSTPSHGNTSVAVSDADDAAARACLPAPVAVARSAAHLVEFALLLGGRTPHEVLPEASGSL